jgi:hypothetical protein
MSRICSSIAIMMIFHFYIIAQVGINTSSPNPSSLLDLSRTTKGFLSPRMTKAQRDGITPVAGLMVYNTTTIKG